MDTAIAQAFRLYSDVVPLDFKQTRSGTADIMILFKGGCECLLPQSVTTTTASTGTFVLLQIMETFTLSTGEGGCWLTPILLDGSRGGTRTLTMMKAGPSPRQVTCL